MKVSINRRKVQSRALLSNVASVGGLILLLASVLLPLFLPVWANIAYVLMFVGLGVAMVGIYFANRWVRKPRPEESLEKALKSLDGQYHLYHYPSLPCDHLLLTPVGLVVLDTINLAGVFSYHEGQWKESMGIGRALRYIVEERVGNPVVSARQVEEELKGTLFKELASDICPPIKTVVVFTHPAVNLEIEDSPVSICKIDKLKKQVRLDGPRLAPELYEKLHTFLESKTN